MFEDLASANPDAIAIVCGEEHISYGTLNERANQIAHEIRYFYRMLYDLEMAPDTPIGIYINPGPNMLVGLLGILKAGGAYMPLDPAYPESRLQGMMEDAQSPLVITEQALVEHLLFLAEGDYGVICLDAGWKEIARQPTTNPVSISGPGSLAYIIYTSGSTGKPKGVMVEHRGVVSLVRNQNYIQVNPSDCLAQAASISFDAATYEIWGALLNGARLAIIDRSALLSSGDLAATHRKYGVTNQFFTTAVFNLLAEGSAEGLAGLRVALFGGEEANLTKVRNVLTRKNKELTLIHVYGPTECTTFSTFCVLSEKFPDAKVAPIGIAIARMHAYVLDEDLQPLPDGIPGELYVGGDGVARGYLNRPELTDERFVENPFASDEERALGRNRRLYKTGDLVRRIPSGELIYIGRADRQIKIRGFRVEPGEIEATLLTHPGIKDCVVTAHGDSHQKRLVAYIIPTLMGMLSSEELYAHLARTLPAFMLPSFFMEMASFPINPNGKIDRKALPAPFTTGTHSAVPLRHGESGLLEPVGPRDELELAVFDIVASALNVHSLGIDESIFCYGANSLIVAQICAAVRSELRVRLDLREVFEHPTVAGVSRVISERKTVAAEVEAAIPKAGRDNPIPLTYQQEQVWFLSKLAPDNRAYNSQFNVRFTGKLDKTVFVKCLNEIIRRHEILRTTFHQKDDFPVQVIHEPWEASLPEIDLRPFPEAQREEELEQRINEEMNHCFDYAELPLVRWRLYRLGEEEWVFLSVEHHFVHDGWEVMIFLSDFKALYVAFLDSQESPLKDLPIQYADFAVWQKNTLCGERLDAKVRYWLDKIADYPHALNLHIDHPRPDVQEFHGDVARFDLNRELYQSLREFSRQRNVTLFTTMYSAFAVLISRYSGQDRLLVGTGVANRGMKETEAMMGMFVNAVLLYSDLSDNPVFLEFLERTKQNILEDVAYYDTPFTAIVKALKASNRPSCNPVFQVIFAFHDSAIPIMEFGGLRGTIMERHNKTAKTDMNVICIPRAEQHIAIGTSTPRDEDLTIMWEFNSDLFERDTIEQIISHYITLLRQIVRDPNRHVNDLEMISNVEKTKLLEFSVGKRTLYNRGKTLHELFEERVRRHPNKTAVFHDGQALSYAELNARANQLAGQLLQTYRDKLGAPIKPGTHVGLCVSRGIDMVVGSIAILKAGGAYVPVSPDYPEKRLRFMLDDAGIRVVLSLTAVKDRVSWLWDGGWAVIVIDGHTEAEANQLRDGWLPAVNESANTALVIYTSGSTGVPKGVCISHRAIHNFVMNSSLLHYSGSDTISQIANHAFDAATFEIWGSLITGAKIVIIDSDVVMDPEQLLKTMEENGITVSFFTTALFNLLSESKIEVLTRLKCVHFGGEMANPYCVRKALAQKGDGTTLINVYGPTECTTYSAVCELTDRHAKSDFIPVGRPLGNYTAYVLDEKLRLVPVGVPGELHIGGDSVANGYLNRDELTAHRFISNPFATEEDRMNNMNLRLYRTGDLTRWLPDGTLHVLGRMDFQVKIRGFRIEPEEVERVLLKHPGVRHCAVMPWEGKLVAYWVPRSPSGVVNQSDLRSFLATQLPEYMVPSGFIETERFELNRNAKIDRTKLPPPALALMAARKGDYVPPRNGTEEALAAIWQDVLKSGRISVHDSFFDLGGNSLLTVRMLGRVKLELNADINLASMFSMPTIAAIATLIDKSGPADLGGENNIALALQDARVEVSVGDYRAEARADQPQHILLTGVTGFLGFHLLDKLLSLTTARIHCLVRGATQETVRAKFRDAASLYGRPDLERNPRIALLKGDLKEPALGLEGETVEELQEILDHICHCGAVVHHMFDYRTLRAENVQSTIELLKIASGGRRKVLNFVSTLSVACRRDPEGRTLEVEIGDRPISTNGYILTKWTSERILARHAEKGLPVNIFRPGNITGHCLTGVCPPENNHALLLLKGCIQMKCAPDWKRFIEMTPVDILAESIVRLSLNTHGSNTFNMNNPLEMSWADYIEALRKLGFEIEMVSVDEWRKRLEGTDETNALFSLKEFYLRDREDLVDLESHAVTAPDSSTTQEMLRKLGVAYLHDYARYIPTAVGYLKTKGFLPAMRE
jgi:amino acid adenylation domain-containing protein/thioester reductase-like protein